MTHHSHPVLQLPSGRFHVVLAHEFEQAIVADPEDRESGRYGLNPALNIHTQSLDAGGDQQASAGVAGKDADMKRLGLGMLNQSRFTCSRVNRKHSDVIFPSPEDRTSV